MNPEAIKAKFTAIQKKAEAANTRQSASRQKWTVGFFLLFVVFGLAFFLMSKWWMPSNITIKHTVPGSSVSLSTYAELTVKRWDFDVTQNLLEVEIEKDAGVIGKDYSYAVNAYGNSSTNQIPLDIVYNGESFFVVQVPNVARFEEILLLVRLDMEEQSYGDYFYCDMEQASRVDIQKEKTDAEYMQLNLLSKADIKEAEALHLRQENEVLQDRIAEYSQSITAIQSEQQYQSGEELDKSTARIEEYTSAINAAEKTIADNEERITLIVNDAGAVRQRAENLREAGYETQ